MKKRKRAVQSPKSKVKKYALLSVWDKQGLKPLAKELVKLGFGLVSSGGTAKFLKAAGIKVTEVQQITKYPHMLGGRVKTLHPLIHGGILGDPNIPEHQKDIKKFGI